MALAFIGKFLIAVSLCFQAYVLFSDVNAISIFNKQLQTVLTSCDCIPPNIAALLEQHIRYLIVGFLACSALMVISRSSFFKLLVLIGLTSLLIIKHHPIKTIPRLDNMHFWQSLAIVGGIIYLMGADVNRKPLVNGKLD